MNNLRAISSRGIGRFTVAALLFLCAAGASAQQALTWEQVKDKFEAANPTLRADARNVDEAKAEEITAFLRPNPDFNAGVDGVQPFTSHPYRPFTNVSYGASLGYLWERDNKRNLRRISAEQNTAVTASQHVDLERNLLFTLRSAFVQTIEAKAVLELAHADLDYYDKIINISQARFKAGDLAQIDLDRIELLRVQYESELETATVNLRTQKIALLQMLDDRTRIDQFDVSGPFGFDTNLQSVDDLRQMALNSRPDLEAALQGIEEAKTNHKLAVANGSTDPTWSVDLGYARSNIPPIVLYAGISVDIPLRIFDRNQGEKQRTQIDIDRNQQLTEATRAQVFSDVDSAYEQVRSNIALLIPYRDKYKDQATRVRDTVTFSYQHGGASLMDFLNAQSDYRVVQLAYLQLIGSYMTAASQLNLAVGREVIP